MGDNAFRFVGLKNMPAYNSASVLFSSSLLLSSPLFCSFCCQQSLKIILLHALTSLACDTTCLTCSVDQTSSGKTGSNCLSCASPQPYLYNGSCLASCPSDLVTSGQTCVEPVAITSNLIFLKRKERIRKIKAKQSTTRNGEIFIFSENN